MDEYDEMRKQNYDLLTVDDYKLQAAYVCQQNGMKAETLNKKMYTGEGELTETEKDFVEMVDRTSVPVKRDISLYRGVGASYIQSMVGSSIGDPDFFQKLDEKVGTTVTHKSVTSTGVGVPVYFDRPDLNVVCRVNVPKGAKVCTTYNFEEGEVLLPAGQELRITGYSVGGQYGVWSRNGDPASRSKKLTVGNSKEKLILEMEVIKDE